MNELNKLVRATLKKYGEGAGEHFGVKQSTLDSYIRKGRYPCLLIEKILAEQMSSGAGAMDSVHNTAEPTTGAPSEVGTRAAPEAIPATPNGERLRVIENYLQDTVDFYLRQFNDRITKVEQTVELLRVEHLRQAGMPSLARPAQGVPVEQVFTTNPQRALNPLDSGIAPTKEMVDAQANITTVEGVPIPNATVAAPAAPIPNAPPFGYGWNQPRPHK